MTTTLKPMLPRTGETSTTVRAWEAHQAPPADFEADWTRALGASSHAHFALDPGYLRWEAAHGQRVRALLIDDRGRRALIAQRWERRRWVSGWPWRWQSLVAGADPGSPVGMTAADAAWLHESVSRFSGRDSVLTYLPHAPAAGVAGWTAGATVIQDLSHPDSELFESMEPSKRRLVRRARGENVEIEVARSAEDFRAFYRLQMDTKRRRGQAAEEAADSAPHAGESWREWELPWMWLLLARRDGEVVAGVGDGVRPGGAMQGRTAAATLEARRTGVTVLLGYEEMRRGRDLGHRWFNFGGDTPFKREMCGRLGRRIRVFAWLGGGRGRKVWHVGEATFRRVRPALARLRRRLGFANGAALTLAHAVVEWMPSGAGLTAGA